MSSAGLLHGVLFALYLCIFKKKKTLTNLLLGLVLVFMAFRIGKSVMLNFGDGLEPIFIFVGLTFLLVIGPLLRWYVLGMTNPKLRLTKIFYYELLPFVLFFIGCLFVTKEWYENSELVLIIFGSGLLFIYLHLAVYIVLSWIRLKQVKQTYEIGVQTKSQKAVLSWLQYVLVGFAVIWVSYVLNILDDAVPYLVGPLVYSVVIYFLSYKAFSLKATDLDGDVFKENDNSMLFSQISQLVIGEKRYLEAELSLSSVSTLMGVSKQKTSEVINQYAQQNFNDFINYHRIQEAKSMLLDASNEKFTISSIAFDTGFSSLSSFNSAFKKFEGTTPSAFRDS
ncbi:MAG: hypothetical protein COA50_10345 [Flavobacteriaceae bacterium]|nr:MAG: hypothetical protein COA50_10345 [Flavobacteriaceae bacterium]